MCYEARGASWGAPPPGAEFVWAPRGLAAAVWIVDLFGAAVGMEGFLTPRRVQSWCSATARCLWRRAHSALRCFCVQLDAFDAL